MKYCAFIFFTIIVIQCCKEREIEEDVPVKKVQPIAAEAWNKKRDVKDFLEFAKSYQISDINIYKNVNDSLKTYDLVFMSADSSVMSEFEKGVYIIFLREYINHLEVGNIGFDLKTMCLGDSKFLFTYFSKNVGSDSTLEFMQSGYVVEKLISDKKYLLKDHTIDSLYSKIVRLETVINWEHGH